MNVNFSTDTLRTLSYAELIPLFREDYARFLTAEPDEQLRIFSKWFPIRERKSNGTITLPDAVLIDIPFHRKNFDDLGDWIAEKATHEQTKTTTPHP